MLSKYHTPPSPLYEKLREEQFVSDGLDKALSTFPPKYPRYRQLQRVYTLNDTFIVDFSRSVWSLNVITEQGVETLKCLGQFAEERPTRITPYTGAYTNQYSWIDDSNEFVGSALARFERSTLPDHKGKRVVVLRFLKMITPVKCVIPLYDGHIAPPQEGELYRRAGSFHQRVWSINIDKPKGLLSRGLKLLWDA